MSSKCGSSHDYDSWADMCKHGALRLVTLVRAGHRTMGRTIAGLALLCSARDHMGTVTTLPSLHPHTEHLAALNLESDEGM